MKKNLIREKSFQFAIKIVKLYRILSHEKKEFVLSKQILKAGTSIGANVRESINAESKADLYVNYQLHKRNVMKQYIGWN